MQPLTISLIGLPGAGKTTLCRSLATQMGWRCFQLGNALRTRAAHDAELKVILDRGELAPESVAIELVLEATREVGEKGLVLDGFPRHREQADLAVNLFAKWVILHLDVDLATATRRIGVRVVCPDCGWLGSYSQDPPKICPSCGYENPQHRPEDSSETIGKRLSLAATLLDDMLQYIPRTVPLMRLDASRSTDAVLSEARSQLNSYDKTVFE